MNSDENGKEHLRARAKMDRKFPISPRNREARNVQLHVLIDERTFRLFIDSIKLLGYGTVAEAVRECIRSKITQAESARDGEFEFKEKVDAEILEQAKIESLTFKQSAKAYRRQRW